MEDDLRNAHGTICAGIGMSRDKLAVAIAGGERGDEVLGLGTFENPAASVGKLLKTLAGRGDISGCDEAGPAGYGFCRQRRAAGYACCVGAPSLIPVALWRCSRLYQATKLWTQVRAAPMLAKPRGGQPGRHLQVRNSASEKALSLLTRGRLKEAVMPSRSIVTFIVAPFIGLPHAKLAGW